jgi:hypothetical protein
LALIGRIDVDAEGCWLVSGSEDKTVKVWRLADGALERTLRVPQGERQLGKVYAVAISPDGSRIAVGYDSTRVDVLDARTLEPRYAADTRGADNGDLFMVAWSADGRELLAGGTYDVDGRSPIRRWSDGGRGPFEDLRVAKDTLMTLHPLPDGRLAVGTQERIALLDAAGEPIWQRLNAIADFRSQLHDKGIRLSQTGDRLAFGYQQWGKRPARLDLRARTQTSDLPPSASQPPADLALPEEGPREGLAVTDWVNSREPKCNGKPLALDQFERSRSLAIAPDGQRFVHGAEWSLRAFDRSVAELRHQAVPGVVWALNISGDGRYAVAGHRDGTLRWHRMRDGAEVLDHLQPSVSDAGRKIVGQITLAIPPQDGVAELIARNALAASEPAAFRINWGGGTDAYKPSLYVLAAGVSQYPEKKARLRFAAEDARAFTAVLEGVSDPGVYFQGILHYAQAKAAFDGLIEEAKAHLAEDIDLAEVPGFAAQLQGAVNQRTAFTDYVAEKLIGDTPGRKARTERSARAGGAARGADRRPAVAVAGVPLRAGRAPRNAAPAARCAQMERVPRSDGRLSFTACWFAGRR